MSSSAEVPLQCLEPANARVQDGVDDIGKLSELNEPALYHLVAARFLVHRKMYTRAGPVLVALNPFAQQPKLYATDVLEAYQRRAKFVEENTAAAAEGEEGVAAAAPHIYEIAASAYQGLLSRNKSQSVVINGESGAGKTESCKLILRCLTHAARDAAASTIARSEALAKRLHATNPILESMGNAKTLRNDNSSRFGKFVRLHFSMAGALTGASVERYLLEKSRVTAQDTNERSFHAMYQLCSGAPAALRDMLQLEEAGDAAASFETLTHGECLVIDGVDDAAGFVEVVDCLESLVGGSTQGGTTVTQGGTTVTQGGTTVTQGGTSAHGNTAEAWRLLIDSGCDQTLWRCIGGVLHVGNVVFAADAEEARASGGNPAVVASDGEDDAGETRTPSAAERALAIAAALWQVEPASLEKALTRRTITAGTELCELRKSVSEAIASRDALAKATYEKLFDVLMELINARLAESGSSGTKSEKGGFIGLLDIFGSEVFAVNGFEQLLINFANERLQQLFTATAIRLVQQEYEAEGLPFTRIEYVDNAPTLALLDGKPISVLSALDDQGLVAGSTDSSYVALLKSHFSQHERFAEPRFGGDQTAFVIHHYAASVTYTGSTGFLAKNKDALFSELPELMRQSASTFVCALFAQSPPGAVAASTSASGDGARLGSFSARGSRALRGKPSAGGGARVRAKSQYVSVSAQFCDSMARLSLTLSSTQCHFIRCIKPNEERAPFSISPKVALTQLRSCGVLEAVRVSQAGYPTRLKFEELIARYAILVPPSLLRQASRERATAALLAPMVRRGASSEMVLPPSSPERRDVLRVQVSGLLGALGLAATEYMLGRTMAFLRTGVLSKCEAARAQALHHAISVMQAIARRRSKVAKYAASRRALLKLQHAAHRRWLRVHGKTVLDSLRAERDARERRADELMRKSQDDAAAFERRKLFVSASARADRAAEMDAVRASVVRAAAVRVTTDAVAGLLRRVREQALVEAAEAARAQAAALSAALVSAAAERVASEARVLAKQQSSERRAEEMAAEAEAEATRRAQVEASLTAAVAAAEAGVSALEEERASASRLTQQLAALTAEKQAERAEAELAVTRQKAAAEAAAAASAAARLQIETAMYMASEEAASAVQWRERATRSEAELAETLEELATARGEVEELAHDLDEAHGDNEEAAVRIGQLEGELAKARAQVATEQEERAEMAEDLEVVQEEKGELEEVNYQYEAQLDEYEEELSELHDAKEELDEVRMDLADAKEEQVRLMEEVKALRLAIKQRDEEVRRAADIQVQLVERLAEEDAQHRTSAPRSAQRATGVSAAKERGSARSWAGGA